MLYLMPHYEIYAELIHSGAFKYDLRSMFNDLESIREECLIQCDDLTEYIFRDFIYNGKIEYSLESYVRAHNANVRYDAARNFIVETLVFKQSQNQDINILAKLTYRRYGKDYKCFLDWQLEKLAAGKEIDILEEFTAYKNSTGHEIRTPDILKQNF